MSLLWKWRCSLQSWPNHWFHFLVRCKTSLTHTLTVSFRKQPVRHKESVGVAEDLREIDLGVRNFRDLTGFTKASRRALQEALPLGFQAKFAVRTGQIKSLCIAFAEALWENYAERWFLSQATLALSSLQTWFQVGMRHCSFTQDISKFWSL